MATSAQINANRANAQKSTGPRSAEGKSASRFNALKHGIDAASIVIPGEDPADYDALIAAYHRDFRPESPSETFHVDTMLRADWQKRRLQRVEADLHRTLLAETPGASLAAALLSDSPAARLLARVPSARSAPSNAPGTAPTPSSAAPAARPRPTPTRPSIATSTVWEPLPARNWLRSPNPQTPLNPPPIRPTIGPRPTKRPDVLCTS
jgi:hypothetical protein